MSDVTSAHARAFHCATAAAALILVHCTDPVVAPDSAAPEGAELDVSIAATWAPTILKVPKEVTSSVANDVNDAGMVVGVVTVQGKAGPHAVRWVNGVMSFLGEPKGPAPVTVVERVNNSGIAVGNYHPGFGENKAVVWTAAGTPRVLTGLPGGTSDWAFDVNDDRVIVGQSQNHAVRWIRGAVQDLHPPRYGKSRALGINTGGDIAGWVESATGERRAYLWRANSTQEELGVLAGDQHSEATALNDALTVVGYSGDLISVSRAFRWTDPLGMSNANLGISKTLATGISNLDRIVGFREFTSNGTARAVALTRRGSELDILPIPLRAEARARGVNLCGDVAGTIGTGSASRAILWAKTSCDP